jgi:phytoene dehydrogenase-like protein
MWQATNGISEYWEAMADKIRANGGTVMTSAHVKSIIVDKGKATGVLIADKFTGDEDLEGEIGSVTRIEAPLVISAIPIWEIFKLIPEDKFPDDFVKKAWNVEERTANLGLTALLSQSIDDNKALYMLDFPNVGYFGTIFFPSNVASNIAPKGKQLFEASIITDYSLKKDQKKVYHMREMLYKDLQIIYPGWEKYVIWQNTYFHYEEPKRTAGRAGKHRPGSKAPNIEGLYFCGDSVASRALPGMECAADSAMLCAKAILGDI